MTPSTVAESISFLLVLYPNAGTKWPVPVREALAENLKPLDVTLEQFKAIAKDIRVNGKNSWMPPEGDLLKRLRTLGSSRKNSSENPLTPDQEEFRKYLDHNRDELSAHVSAWKVNDPKFGHWCDSWFLDVKYPLFRVWALKFIPWAMERAIRSNA